MARETYAQARARILNHLEAERWDVHRTPAYSATPLKVPYAITPRGGRVNFNPQAVHLNGLSMWEDIRHLTGAQFIRAVETSEGRSSRGLLRGELDVRGIEARETATKRSALERRKRAKRARRALRGRGRHALRGKVAGRAKAARLAHDERRLAELRQELAARKTGTKRYEARGVLAGAYGGKSKRAREGQTFLTHYLAVSPELEAKTLCRRIAEERLCDVVEESADCPVCVERFARLAAKGQASS